LIDSLKEVGLTSLAKLALRLITILPPTECKKLVAEIRSHELKPNDGAGLSDHAKVLTLPTNSNLSLDNSICVYLLVNYFMECLKTVKYISKDVSDMTSDLAFLLARAILVSCQHSSKITVGEFVEKKDDLWNMSGYPKHVYAVGIFPRFALLKHISVKAADKSGAGSDVITFFQVGFFESFFSL